MTMPITALQASALEPVAVTMTRRQWRAVLRALHGIRTNDLAYNEDGETDAVIRSQAREILEFVQGDGSTDRSRPVTAGLRIIDQNPGHTTATLFVGRTGGSRGNAGQITIRTGEWEAFLALTGLEVLDA